MNISIRLTDKCNLKCKMCSRRNKIPENDMSFEIYLDILDQCSDLNIFGQRIARFRLDGNREALMYPRLTEAVEEASKRGLFTYFLTNGVLLDKNKAKELLSAGLGQIIFSVTGITPSVYSEFQGSGSSLACAEDQLNTVVNNITEFVRLSKKITPNTSVEVSYILDKTSLPDINDAYFFWKKAGISQFLVNNIGGHKSERFGNEQDINTICPTKPSKEKSFCLKTMVIIPNGDIYPCCRNEKIVVGNYFEKSLNEIFNSESFYELAHKVGSLDVDRLPVRCLTCDVIKYDNKYQLHI